MKHIPHFMYAAFVVRFRARTSGPTIEARQP